jgi:DNA repair ATPase RecN
MAQRQDLLGRLADRGEEAIQRMGEMPGAGRFLEVAMGLRDRMDELQKRTRDLAAMERRLNELERKVDRLGTPSGSRAKSGTGTRKKAAPKTPSTSRATKASGTKRASGSSARKPTTRKRPSSS